ncbi:IS66 family element, transposase domain protein [Leptospira kirschneri str. H2]|nr:IS66 family element, transposase domain protein [Leptospira kirschneri str. H2]EKO61690.1 IS66 family element, transposase domain protein [Leptospira kirschneri str. H2]
MIEDIRKELFKSKYLQIDETVLQVLNEVEKPNTSKSYMWVIRGLSERSPLFFITTNRVVALSF